MKGDPRTVDGNRHRCVACGHPRKEHRPEGCSVPRCPCAGHMMRGLKESPSASS